MLSELPPNIVLLLLQIILTRQQEIVRMDKEQVLDLLLLQPILENGILQQFITHKLTQIYSPQVQSFTLRRLKTLLAEIFERGFRVENSVGLPPSITNKFQDGPVNIVYLANFYYEWRLWELQESLIPSVQRDIVDLI